MTLRTYFNNSQGPLSVFKVIPGFAKLEKIEDF